MFYRSRSSSTSSSMSNSPTLAGAGWVPKAQHASPSAITITAETDYFACKANTSAAASLRRDSTSSTSSNAPSITFSASSPLSPSIAYPCWAEAQTCAITSQQLPPTYIASSYISNDDLEALDFSPASRKSSPMMSAVCEPEFDAGAAGISWSATRQPCVPQREERRRRLPPPPPGMMTTCSSGRSSSKRKSSKERRQKALSMIKE